jgi:hypothetical protein
VIDQASIDRAVAYLLDVAEGAEPPDDARITAAQTVLMAQTPFDGLGGAEPCGDPELDAVYSELEMHDLVADAFRAGARWRKHHPDSARTPSSERIARIVSGTS